MYTVYCTWRHPMIQSLFHGRDRLAFIANDSSVVSSTKNTDSFNSFSLSSHPSSPSSWAFAASTPPLTVWRTSASCDLWTCFVCWEATDASSYPCTWNAWVATCIEEVRSTCTYVLSWTNWKGERRYLPYISSLVCACTRTCMYTRLHIHAHVRIYIRPAVGRVEAEGVAVPWQLMLPLVSL